MLSRNVFRGFDERRMRYFLAILFVALAAPTAVLIWQAWGQLKWEAYHQYRGTAEELTARIDARLVEMMNSAHARSFADYTFLVVSGDPSASFVQRSPLSAYPVQQDLPGVVGYFQVDPDGRFSTPILPPDGTEAASLGIGDVEYASRLRLAEEIRAVLADNRLVQHEPSAGALNRVTASPSWSRAEQPVAGATYSQSVFDRLNEPVERTLYDDGSLDAPAREGMASGVPAEAEPERQVSKLSELKLDDDLQEKSEQADRKVEFGGRADEIGSLVSNRAKRREQIALPESAEPEESVEFANVSSAADLRISTFESEVDLFEFSVLDSGHFVLFRRVWRDGERYIQGFLLDRERFADGIVGERFEDTVLAGMSDLIVAYHDDVIGTFTGRPSQSYPNVAENLHGTLLYRSRLSAPLDGLELVFSIQSLPPGAGGRVLGWVTLVLAIVFVGGFVALHQLGMAQIRLTRQQQDFVSAVSHELKTPLTSIRMYGEMLREGWADEAKRQSYYEYIHDESERLSRLISNVLQLARITRNDPEFDLRPVPVGQLMSSIESKISGQVERAGFELRVRTAVDVRDTSVLVDEDCFAQIVINLVDNAVKFSRDADEKVIEVGARRMHDGRVSISVRDFGPGIPKDQMTKIFRLFYRSESELTRETVGTGIGLAIVHQLTAAMGGEVDLVNAEPGAEFRIRLPRGGPDRVR